MAFLTFSPIVSTFFLITFKSKVFLTKSKHFSKSSASKVKSNLTLVFDNFSNNFFVPNLNFFKIPLVCMLEEEYSPLTPS